MNPSQARDAVNGAALVVAGIYFYRKLLEPTVGSSSRGASDGSAVAQPTSIGGSAAQLVGFGPLASTGRFIVGFGFTFIVLSLAEGASPQLAGYFALLIALGSILGNGIQVAADLSAQLKLSPTAPSAGDAPAAPTTRVVGWGGAPEGEIPPQAAPRSSGNKKLKVPPKQTV